MTREEEIKKEAWENKEVDFPHEFIRAAQWADKTMLKKACEWFKNFLDYHYVMRYSDCNETPIEVLLENFRKAMEG